ncbi:MAG: hypothetical protein JO325_01250 [Solirubrobacterales bacterium]|nr:hypothetical protein [Solirubrobacterales bacterium]
MWTFLPERLAAVILAAVILAAALLAPATAHASAPRAGRSLSPEQQGYLAVVEHGFQEASSHWGNRPQHWYNAVLHDRKRYPLATIWDAVPLFEAVDETALASPTAANENRVVAFADYGERYWDRNVTPAPGVRKKTPAYAPYPGSWNDVETFFDDDGWWGLAFMDASQAMRQSGRLRLGSRYLADAERAFTFIDNNGWDTADGGGIWWNTDHVIPGGHGRSGEALAAATDLAARLYQAAGQPLYLQAAENYITWANHNIQATDGNYGLQISDASVMPSDGQGAMVAAFTTLCEAGVGVPPSVYAGIPANQGGAEPSYRLPSDPTSWCSWAEALAAHTAFGVRIGGGTYDGYLPLNDGPEWDDIYVRGLLSLYGYDHDSRWYGVANQTAQRILAYAQSSSGLFLKAWNGSSSVPGSVPGMLRTDASSLSVLAALAGAAPSS